MRACASAFALPTKWSRGGTHTARYEVIKGLMSMTYGRVEPVYPGLRRTLFTTLILPS